MSPQTGCNTMSIERMVTAFLSGNDGSRWLARVECLMCRCDSRIVHCCEERSLSRSSKLQSFRRAIVSPLDRAPAAAFPHRLRCFTLLENTLRAVLLLDGRPDSGRDT